MKYFGYENYYETNKKLIECEKKRRELTKELIKTKSFSEIKMLIDELKDLKNRIIRLNLISDRCFETIMDTTDT